MRRGLDWYKREPIAFLDGVQGMGPELIGAYAVLLDLIYARGGETRRDDRHLAGLLGCSLRKARSLTDELIEREKIEVQDGFITNSRAKRQSKSARNIRETRAKSGRKGGEKSAESRKNKGLDEAGASDARAREEKIREEREVTNVPSLSLAPSPPDAKAREREIEAAFEEFWNAYPHRGGAKKGKAPARAKWRTAIKDGADPRQIIEAAKAHHADRRVVEGYARDPATWLNQRGWEDEIEPVRAPSNGGNANGRSAAGARAVSSREVGLAAQRLAAASRKPR